MRATTFWSANVLGTLARVALVRRLGNEARTWPAAARAAAFARANRRVIAIACAGLAAAAAASVVRELAKALEAEKARRRGAKRRRRL